MPFGYYKRLNREQKAVYRRSDEVSALRLPEPRRFHPTIVELAGALAQQNQPRTQALCQRLVDAMMHGLRVSPVRVTVLAVRPANDWGELHGFYRPETNEESASITVWMRTAQRRQVVAFRTFLRTLLHEVCHHLDYTLLALDHSFHTQGFYRRESSLFHQLVPAARAGATGANGKREQG